MIILGSFLVCFTFISIFRNMSEGTRHSTYEEGRSYYRNQELQSLSLQTDRFAGGPAIAPKLGNETAKAELGRAAWKLFHTMFARFPDEPTEEESVALMTYIHLFQRLYPCGECATHFGQILNQFPPQVSSRSTAAAWGCHVHNEVNKSLDKPIFDCSNIGDFYDCGCAPDAEDDDGVSVVETKHSGRPGMDDDDR